MSLVIQTLIAVFDELNVENTCLGFASETIKIFFILISCD